MPEAYVWDRPAAGVPIALAASGPSSSALAAEYADGLISADPDARVVELFDEAGGDGKPRFGQVAVCWGPDEAECRKRLVDQWRWAPQNWKVKAELPGPESFASASQFTREEDLARTIPCGPDVDKHIEAFNRYVDAGFTHVAFVQVGGDSQAEFLDWAERELMPRLHG
ncbi:hypothetical protein Pflav_000120 [Phytohabitans flavus]|uniref:Luciferase-like domain-containing protein n=1 Tax=Phytohabitans flavus TaxID=1076124 RepID=A0A6F8XIG4_9ACTN|nr:hypothetical protein Pflav_000120 [Phytohabitans flavus]